MRQSVEDIYVGNGSETQGIGTGKPPTYMAILRGFTVKPFLFRIPSGIFEQCLSQTDLLEVYGPTRLLGCQRAE